MGRKGSTEALSVATAKVLHRALYGYHKAVRICSGCA